MEVVADIGFSPEELQVMLDNIDQYSDDEVFEIEKMVDELEKRRYVQACRDDLIEFCKHMQADYKVGTHHRRLAALLEDIEAGRKDRICVSVPPRHGKSQLVSIYYAAWYLGRNPTHKVMLVSHTTDLAVDFGRKVRNLIASDAFRQVFQSVDIASDNKSAGRWNTNQGGEFFAAGVGSALAGRGAHMLLVDDPHSEQDVLSGNFGVFEKAYEWFAFGARTRLMPGGKVAIVHCMAGDTPVLRPDGTETPLKDIRAGDMVASYRDGALVARKVLNHANQGPDRVYTIAMDNGNLIRANARHPFLAVRDGVEAWVKVQDLRLGDSLVSLKGASASPDPRARAANALRAYLGTLTTEKTRMRPTGKRGTGGSGPVRLAAQMDVPSQWNVVVCAGGTMALGTTSDVKRLVWLTIPRSVRSTTSLLGTVSRRTIMRLCAPPKAIAALFASPTPMTSRAQALGGQTTHSPLTTATTAEKYARSCATRATSSCTADSPSRLSNGPFSTSRIISITPDGVEDVYDLQVAGTENFIANGTVSHNTRWHMDDLIGRVIRDMSNNESADQYEVFEFPAILELAQEDGSVVEKALWPEFFDLPALRRTKASMPTFQWNAQYQQTPTAEEAAIVKREWWRLWGKDDPPACEYIISSLDAAAEKHNRADFTALTTWGVFLNEEEDAYQLILLNSVKERLEFPELKQLCLDHVNSWEPDAFIVEKKSAGVAIYQELRRMGIPVQEYTPHRGTGDKMARLNSVSDIIASGMVWVPPRRWAEEVVEEVAGFPFMSHDDLVDSTVMALMRFRQGGFIRLPTDDYDDELPYRHRMEYY